jgi:predicted metal-binding membrane protein
VGAGTGTEGTGTEVPINDLPGTGVSEAGFTGGLGLFSLALRRDRVLVVGALLVTVALSWLYLLGGAGMHHEADGMSMPMSPWPWTAGHALLLLAMWLVMMAAMMLPGAAPAILLHGAIAARRSGQGSADTTVAFVLGYLAVWAAFSIGAVSLQFGLQGLALLSPMMASASGGLTGALLLLAGLYQWSPLKRRCLAQCRSPLAFFLANWREGRKGAFSMGLRHGVSCVGCCWALMMLLFVGGVMHPLWIGGIALFVLLEKTVPRSAALDRVAGVVLVVAGVLALVGWSQT